MGKLKIDHHADFEQVLVLIQEARNRVFSKANAELVMLYFNVGKLVSQKVSQGIWGDSVVDELAKHIEIHQPELSGFNRRGLYRMKQFYEVYSENQFVSPLATQIEVLLSNPTAAKKVSAVRTQSEIKDRGTTKVSAVRTLLKPLPDLHQQFVSAVLTQLNWTNHRLILSKTKTAEERFYYLLTSIKEKYSSRELERALNSAQFERTMLSNKVVTALPTQLPQNLFKDPYIFEFLDLPDTHSEKDLEKALIQNLRKFILEVGKGFTYMGNQYRLQVGNKDYYTDLLFYHRDLKCLVLFELKIEDFAPEFLGKLNFYLEVLDRDVKRPNEKPSIGILLCKGKDTEVVEYAMARNTSPAVIADYETKLIDKKLLTNKLHQLAAIFNKENNF